MVAPEPGELLLLYITATSEVVSVVRVVEQLEPNQPQALKGAPTTGFGEEGGGGPIRLTLRGRGWSGPGRRRGYGWHGARGGRHWPRRAATPIASKGRVRRWGPVGQNLARGLLCVGWLGPAQNEQ
jgi:hypothetical protein